MTVKVHVFISFSSGASRKMALKDEITEMKKKAEVPSVRKGFKGVSGRTFTGG